MEACLLDSLFNFCVVISLDAGSGSGKCFSMCAHIDFMQLVALLASVGFMMLVVFRSAMAGGHIMFML